MNPAPQVLYTRFSAVLGMVHILMPYMVMSLYAAMRKINPDHLRAAASLGASPLQAFRDVYLPLSLPGVVNGCTLVFIICLGFYVTPVLLGGPRDQMIAGLIGEQIQELLDWGLASAMAVVLLATTLGLLAIYNRLVGLDKLWG
jgi:ABC-type spermidine/putrescine transport system permease subunit I